MSSDRQRILNEITEERIRQIAKWGKQHRPSTPEGTTQAATKQVCNYKRQKCNEAEERGPFVGYTGGASWQEILEEECWEAYAEFNDRAARRKELIQCAAVIVAWIEDLDDNS